MYSEWFICFLTAMCGAFLLAGYVLRDNSTTKRITIWIKESGIIFRDLYYHYTLSAYAVVGVDRFPAGGQYDASLFSPKAYSVCGELGESNPLLRPCCPFALPTYHSWLSPTLCSGWDLRAPRLVTGKGRSVC